MEFSDIVSRVQRNLGTTKPFSSADVKDAINRLNLEYHLTYDFEEHITEGTIAFTSGVGTMPTDFLRTVWELQNTIDRRDLWNSSTDKDYDRVSITVFDGDIDNTWTEKEGSVRIFSADTVTLAIRYRQYDEMSDDTDDNLQPKSLDIVFPLNVAYLLLFENRLYDEAGAIQQRLSQINMAHFAKFKKDVANMKESTYQKIGRRLKTKIII